MTQHEMKNVADGLPLDAARTYRKDGRNVHDGYRGVSKARPRRVRDLRNGRRS